MNYCYKVKHKFLKKRPDGSRDIEEYFGKFVEKENGYEEIYSLSYRLLPDSPLVRGDISLFNDVKWQKATKLAEHIDEFAKEGIHFTETNEGFVLIEDEETLKDFEMCRLCVDLIDEDTHGLLFLLRSDGRTMYFNANIIKDNLPDIIEGLLRDNVIYKTVAPGDKVKKKRNGKA